MRLEKAQEFYLPDEYGARLRVSYSMRSIFPALDRGNGLPAHNVFRTRAPLTRRLFSSENKSLAFVPHRSIILFLLTNIDELYTNKELSNANAEYVD